LTAGTRFQVFLVCSGRGVAVEWLLVKDLETTLVFAS